MALVLHRSFSDILRFKSHDLSRHCIYTESIRLLLQLRYSIKWRCVCKALLKRIIHSLLSTPWPSAVGVHGNRKLRSSPHTTLVLTPEACIAAHQLLLEVAVTTETGSPHFTAGVVFAIGPVQICTSAVVVSVDQLMCQSV